MRDRYLTRPDGTITAVSDMTVGELQECLTYGVENTSGDPDAMLVARLEIELIRRRLGL